MIKNMDLKKYIAKDLGKTSVEVVEEKKEEIPKIELPEPIITPEKKEEEEAKYVEMSLADLENAMKNYHNRRMKRQIVDTDSESSGDSGEEISLSSDSESEEEKKGEEK